MNSTTHTIAMAGVTLILFGALITRPSEPRLLPPTVQIPRDFGWQEVADTPGTYRFGDRQAALTLTPKMGLFDGRTLLGQSYGVPQGEISLNSRNDQSTYGTVATSKGTVYATCLLSDGSTVTTRDEYVAHQNRQATRTETLWGYFLGRNDLRQWQCLWIELKSQGDFSKQEFETLIDVLSQKL